MNATILLNKLVTDSDFFTKVYSYLQPTDFEKMEHSLIFKRISKLYDKYKKVPSFQEIAMSIQTGNELREQQKEMVYKELSGIQSQEPDVRDDILIDLAEQYVKNVRYDQILEKGISVREGTNKKDTLESLMKDHEEIIKISFSSSDGHDYKHDAKSRFDYYGNMDENGISSGIELIDIAGGANGVKPKSLTILLSESNAGKSSMMAHWATKAMIEGRNVAVFTMEDGEEGYGSRIDANLMNKTLDEMKENPQALDTIFSSIIKESAGNIKIKEYPSGTPTVLNFKRDLEDWKNKEGFVPDIIFVDYIGIMTTTKKFINGYEKGKHVSEDLRALATELKVPVVSALQMNRDGFSSLDATMANSADSIAVPQTADVMIALMVNEETPNKRYLKILKSRSVNKSKFKVCAVNFSSEYQRFWDIEDGKRQYIKKDIKERAEAIENTVEESMNMSESDMLQKLMDGQF